jgi:hypothetical protein
MTLKDSKHYSSYSLFKRIARILGYYASQRQLLRSNIWATQMGDTMGQLLSLKESAPRIIVRTPLSHPIPTMREEGTKFIFTPDTEIFEIESPELFTTDKASNYPEWELRVRN